MMNVDLRGIGARADGGAGCAGILNATNKLHAVNERHIRSFVGFGPATIISPATSAGKREVEIRCSGGEVRWQGAGHQAPTDSTARAETPTHAVAHWRLGLRWSGKVARMPSGNCKRRRRW